MTEQRLKITIEGTAGTGKTHIACLIQEALENYGLKIQIHDKFDDIPINVVQETREDAFRNISLVFKDYTIPLDIVNSNVINKDYCKSIVNRPVKQYIYVEPTIDEIMEDLAHIHVQDEKELKNMSYRDLHRVDFITSGDEIAKVHKSRFNEEITLEILHRKGFKNNEIHFGDLK